MREAREVDTMEQQWEACIAVSAYSLDVDAKCGGALFCLIPQNANFYSRVRTLFFCPPEYLQAFPTGWAFAQPPSFSFTCSMQLNVHYNDHLFHLTSRSSTQELFPDLLENLDLLRRAMSQNYVRSVPRDRDAAASKRGIWALRS